MTQLYLGWMSDEDIEIFLELGPRVSLAAALERWPMLDRCHPETQPREPGRE